MFIIPHCFFGIGIYLNGGIQTKPFIEIGCQDKRNWCKFVASWRCRENEIREVCKVSCDICPKYAPFAKERELLSSYRKIPGKTIYAP